MPENKNQNKEFYNLVGYVDGRKKKVGHAYKTDKGSICIKADGLLDPVQIGRLLKKGLYVEKRGAGKSRQDNKAPANAEYQSAADEYDRISSG